MISEDTRRLTNKTSGQYAKLVRVTGLKVGDCKGNALECKLELENSWKQLINIQNKKKFVASK